MTYTITNTTLREQVTGTYDGKNLAELTAPVAWSGTVDAETRREQEADRAKLVDEIRDALTDPDVAAVQVERGEIVGYVGDVDWIEVATYGSLGIRAKATEIGATRARLIGSGHSDGNADNPDSRVTFLALAHPEYGEVLVAETNGDPVWESSDEDAFRALAEDCGVDLVPLA